MVDLLKELNDRIKVLGGDWAKYTVVGSFLLYVLGYLTLRFHLTAIGIGTDLAVLDERYLFAGARFLVYLVAAVPNIVLIALPIAAVLYLGYRIIPRGLRARACAWLIQPTRLSLTGIVIAVLAIQLVMRQCFVFSNLLLARELPAEPAWLARLLVDDRLMPLYFSGLVATCLVSLGFLWALRGRPAGGADAPLAKGLLAFLVAVQFLLLPVNYGVLIADKSLPRVVALGDKPLEKSQQAWLVWEEKDGITFLVRADDGKRRSLVTLPRGEIKKTEITGYDRIFPTLFGVGKGTKT